ncbi:MAG: LytTR family DNA-binding domain-containing protein [Spirosomataceae bacterium]
MNPSLFRLSTFETGQFADFREIVCFVADGNYSLIYLNNGRILVVSKCLECLEQHVPENSFLRIHKSYLINPRFVACLLADKQLKLTNGAVYPISRRKWRQTRLHFKSKTSL